MLRPTTARVSTAVAASSAAPPDPAPRCAEAAVMRPASHVPTSSMEIGARPAGDRDALQIAADLHRARSPLASTGRPGGSTHTGTIRGSQACRSARTSSRPSIASLRLGMERRERVVGIGLEPEQLLAPFGPFAARRMVLRRRQRTRDHAAVAQAMEDRLAAMELDAAHDMRVMADHRIRAQLDRRLGQGPLVGLEHGRAYARAPCAWPPARRPLRRARRRYPRRGWRRPPLR